MSETKAIQVRPAMTLKQRVRKSILFMRLVTYGVRTYYNSAVRRTMSAKWAALFASAPKNLSDADIKTIVIVGAAFSGYYAARILATSLPRTGQYRIVVIEPNSHFNFTWVFPRFCVVEGHEHKAFIPYTAEFFAQGPKNMVNWIRDRVQTVKKEIVVLRSGEEVKYDYLVIATGSTVPGGLPSRAGGEGREGGMERLRGMQARIKKATHIVVAGGGAAGVELATDAKDLYPDKSVTIVHSRQALMHRFSSGLQQGTADAMTRLGVEVVLNEKVDPASADGKTITLSSGRQLDCDCFINCTGQKPASGLIAELAPHTITESGHIRVKPTLQIDDDSLPNVYVSGDVAAAHARNANSRIAARQGEIAADNIIRAIRGKAPNRTYKEEWGDEVIKLTLGLDRSITQFWDGTEELLFPNKDSDLALMCDGAWSALGAKPFEDTGVYTNKA
ncbi:hypothetical protein QBC38DRAFT_489790 [Podospora fimiseda]|uniref:FAD/NAD(P)-binding domain-containing protein n=1 Tax=Podospora fimiseda TaxID=252190 RepID=A0AAN6YPV5_9PEZI|nr:hypothetical protein QBC38DRAFT_489790 [Podospora fimiseda]